MRVQSKHTEGLWGEGKGRWAVCTGGYEAGKRVELGRSKGEKNTIKGEAKQSSGLFRGTCEAALPLHISDWSRTRKAVDPIMLVSDLLPWS